jgi:hypothetical protein
MRNLPRYLLGTVLFVGGLFLVALFMPLSVSTALALLGLGAMWQGVELLRIRRPPAGDTG